MNNWFMCITCFVIKAITNNNTFVSCILGGIDTIIETAPFQVNYGDICGGVLLHKQWALTSAHCGTNITFIRIGNNNRLIGEKIKIYGHVVHPKFGLLHQFDYDVQLLYLRRGLRFNKKVKPILISNRIKNSVDVYGWGYSTEKGEYNEILQNAEMTIIPMKICQEIKQDYYHHVLTDRMFCAGGKMKDACQGDSGGAAVSNGQLIGICSFGFGCGRGYPGVYVNLTNQEIYKWIKYYITR